jgi:hypothetical protein
MQEQRETDLRGSKQGDNYHNKIHPSIGKLSECVVLINLLHDFQLLLCMIRTIHLQVNLHIHCTSATIQEQLLAVKLSKKEPWSLMQRAVPDYTSNTRKFAINTARTLKACQDIEIGMDFSPHPRCVLTSQECPPHVCA